MLSGLIVLMLGGHLHGVGHDHAVRPDDALGQAGRAAGVRMVEKFVSFILTFGSVLSDTLHI